MGRMEIFGSLQQANTYKQHGSGYNGKPLSCLHQAQIMPYPSPSSYPTLQGKALKFLVLILILLVGGFSVSAQNIGDYRSTQTGNWNQLNRWQRYNGAGSWAQPSVAQGFPGQNAGTGMVTIQNGHNVTLNVSPTNNIGALAISNIDGANWSISTLVLNANETLSVSGNLSIAGGNGQREASFTNNGTIRIGGATSFGTNNATYTVGNQSTFDYNGGNQTINPIPSNQAYANLTLSGTGTKNLSSGTTVNGIMSMEGTATASGTSPNYNNNATLQYKGSAAQVSGTELPATWDKLGGILIDNPSGVTLNKSVTVNNVALNIKDNAILNTGIYTLNANGSLVLGNNGTLNVSADGTFNLAANTISSSSNSNEFDFNVYGAFGITSNPTIPNSSNIHIFTGGTMTTNTLTLNGPVMHIVNDGTLNPGTLQFNNSSAVITIENNNSMTVTNTLNISQGTARFKNTGTLSVGQNYNSSATSIYINCGTFTGSFNLNNGGKLINSGTFTSGQIEFGGSASRVENYGSFTMTSGINLSGSVFYNEGIMTFTNGTFQGTGTLQGPSDNSNKGFFGWSVQASLNNPYIGPNLNFSGTAAAMFNGSQIITGTVLFSQPESSVTLSANIDCANPDGSPSIPIPISSSTCSGVNLTTLNPGLGGVFYEWWTGSSTSRGSQITAATSPSVTNYTIAGTVYLWAKNVSSGIYSPEGAAVVVQSAPAEATTPNPANSATGICYAGTIPVTSISWAAATGATSYDVYFGAGSLPSTVTANIATNNYFTGTLVSNTTYHWRVISKDNCGNETSSSNWTFTTASSPCINYCAASGDCTNNRHISRVRLGTIDVTSTCGGYSDFTAYATSLSSGTSNDLTLNYANQNGSYETSVWIDWNQDGVFNNTNERVVNCVNIANGVTQQIFAISIPSDALLGSTRMRIRLGHDGYCDPCGADLAEVEDYTLNVIDCTTPISLTCPAPLTVYTNPNANLQTYYPFNETSGTTATNEAGSGDASLENGATWAVGMRCNGALLAGGAAGSSSNYVALPTGVVNYPSITVATWVYWRGGDNFQRIFDFGYDGNTTTYMYLTPSDGTGMRFSITLGGTGAQERINAPALAQNTWQHVAITLSTNGSTVTGILYVNGYLASTNTSMTISSDDIGATTDNWIGRSKFTNNDEFLNGTVDEFRIYSRALSENEIKTLANTGTCGAFADLGTPTATGGCGTISLSNNASFPLAVGSHTITWTATDGTNTETCTQSVTVENNYNQPVITTQPANPAAVEEENGVAVISVGATGCNLQYQWQVSPDYGGSWSDILNTSPFYSGTDTDELTITNPTYEMNEYWYRVVIEENAYCGRNIESGHAVLTVTSNTCVLVASLSSTPLSLPCNSDGEASVIILQGSGNYSYLWSTGASSASVSNLAAGNYWVDVTDITCAVTQRYYTTIATSYNEGCATSGKDGNVSLSSPPNIYSTGDGTSALLYAGSSQIEVPAAFASSVEAGDLLLIIQIQGADINISNSSSFGETSNVTAGNYEYVSVQRVVSNNIVLHPSTPVQNNYVNTEATSTTTRKRYQIIKVPQYDNLTLTGNITVPAWDGEHGGIFAIDVAGTLNLNGYTISANGAGFRGGASASEGGLGFGANTDYYFLSTRAGHGFKGEGIAGTPAQVYNGSSVVATGTDYPGGTGKGRGAPGNAGGGGNDADVSNNDENTGGGGGANISTGGNGGDPWNGGNFVNNIGGRGGRAFSGSASAVVMGGGGGGGTANNSFVPHGGNGGGIVFIHAEVITGSGTITANGNEGYPGTANDGNDGGGGGGAGGSVIISANTNSTTFTINANGGRGSDAEIGGAAHGPGGGGSGGAVYAALPSAPTINTSSGANGVTTTSSIAYGSSSGTSGNSISVNEASLAGITVFGRNCDPLDITPPVLTCPLPLTSCNATPPDAYSTLALFISAGGTASDDGSGIEANCFALQSQTTAGNITTYIYEIYDNAGNMATCEHTYTLTPPIDVIVTASNSNYCPEFLPPVDLNANAEPPLPGYTLVEYEIAHSNAGSNWVFKLAFSITADPVLAGLTAEDILVYDSGTNEITPDINGLYTASTADNPVTVTARILNRPGHKLDVKLTITDVESAGCAEEEISNNEVTLVILPMPVIGNFN